MFFCRRSVVPSERRTRRRRTSLFTSWLVAGNEEPDVIGNCRDRAGHSDKLEHGQLRGIESRQMQQGQGAAGIVAMHFL